MSDIWIPPQKDEIHTTKAPGADKNQNLVTETYVDTTNPYDMLVEFQRIISEIDDFDDQVKKARELFALLRADAVGSETEIEATIASSMLLLTPERSRPDVANRYDESAVVGSIEDIGFMDRLFGHKALSIMLSVDATYVFPIAKPDRAEFVARAALIPVSQIHYIKFNDAA